MQEFVVLLAEKLYALEGQVIRKDYFATEEGHDLLVKALEEARKTRSRDKREHYARILAGAVLDFERREYSPEEYLHLLSDLTERDLMVARSLYDARPGTKVDGPWDSWRAKVRADYGIDESDLVICLSRLTSFGLLHLMVATDGEEGALVFASNPGETVYEVTPAFEKLMRFLTTTP